jgi:hypothetical protein
MIGTSMAEKILTQERLKQVLNYDPKTGLFKRYARLGPKREIAGHVDSGGHRQIMVDGKLYMAHRLAWFYVYGCFPDNHIDHINRSPDDNRICNLRTATNSQNQQNTKIRKTNVSGFKGIGYDKRENKWRARITFKDKTICLGRHKTIDLALEARKQAENKYFTHHKG